jgi:hypothetical protein
MNNAKHMMHVLATVVAVVVAGALAIVSGGDSFAIALALGATTGVSYWAGALLERFHHTKK